MDTETSVPQQDIQKPGLGTVLVTIIILGIFGYVFFVSAGHSAKELIPRQQKEPLQNLNTPVDLPYSHNNIEIGDTAIIDDEQYFVFSNDNEVQELGEPKDPVVMCGNYPCYTDDEFLKLYNALEKKSGLSFLSKYIYQDEKADTYIKSFAEKRGYQPRPFADDKDIVPFEQVFTRVELKKAYIAMRDEMLEAGIRLHFVSGYRDSTSQRNIFKEKMGPLNISEIPTGAYDEKLDEVLSRSALPGYSKHHSGYAVDFGCGNDYLVYKFSETPCFDWLSENNFENAKRFGFIPSYPEDAPVQGPNPEPWEFVWVGEEMIKTKAL